MRQIRPVPKPKQKRKGKSALRKYRKEQRLLAIQRDAGLCQYCYRLKGKYVDAQEVHHVFGRGRKAGDWRESYKSLLSTCRDCHPSGTSRNRGDEVSEWVLEQANKFPLGGGGIMKELEVANKTDMHWIPFPFPFNMIDNKRDWKSIWRDAVRRASEVFKKQYGVEAWYIFIPPGFAKDWMYEIAKEDGIVKILRNKRRPKRAHALMFYLGTPNKDWLGRSERLNNTIFRSDHAYHAKRRRRVDEGLS